MIEWWLGRHSSSMRSGLCVEFWSGHGESKSQGVASIQNACFNVEAVIEIEGFKVGPKRSHVALRNLRIERSKSRSSSSSSSSSEPFLSPDFELALVFDKPGQYTLPITDITRIRCKYLQQGKASIEAKGSLVLLNAVTQGDLERLLLFIRDVKTGKTPIESQSCVICREKGHKVKHKREELQSSVLDCIFRKRQLLHVSPGQDQVLEQLRDLRNRDHVHKSKNMGLTPRDNEDRPYVLDRDVFEPGSKNEDRFQDAVRHYGRENSGFRRSPPAYFSRSREGQESRRTSPTVTRVRFDERPRRMSEDVRRRERPGTWSGRRRGRESLSPEGEKENLKGEAEVRRIGEETVRRLAEERRRADEGKRKLLEEQRRRAEQEQRKLQEEQRKNHEDERRHREDVRRLEEEERRQVEERERKSQEERRRREEREKQKEELRKLVEEQERKRKDERERRALDEERRRKDEEERLLQELRRQRQEEERLRKDLERRIQEQEQLRKQEEERRRKEEEDQVLLDLKRQKDEEERQTREQERRLQEQVFEVRRRQEEDKKKQEALRRQRQEEERLLQERRKHEELRRQKLDEQTKRGFDEERRPRQASAGVKVQEDPKMRVFMEEEREKQEENRRRALEDQREKLEQRRLDEEMRQWQREEDQRRTKEDKWNMSDEERTRLEEQRHRVEEVMKMTRDLARKRLEETVKEEERRRHAQEEHDEEFCREFVDEDRKTFDEDLQRLFDKANNVASLEEVLTKLKERCLFRGERVASDNIENESPISDHSKGMSYLFTRLYEKKNALKEEEERILKEEARLNVKPENSSDFQVKAEKQRQEELKRHEVERKRAEKAANALKKKLLQEQLRAAKLEARRLERVRKEAEKRARAEERAKQQQKAHEQARKQAQEQGKQQHYPSAPQRWPSYNHRPLTYQEYEEAWNQMKLSRKGATLGYADIPWPPAGNPLFIESGDSLEVHRRKLRIALLRWHPDKFMALCGDRLGSTDRESIETQAKHLAQQVIQWKTRLEQA